MSPGLSAKLKIAGVEQDWCSTSLKVQPEFSLPKASQDGKKLEWTEINVVHLFWGIKRQDRSDEEWNCQLQYRDVVPVVAAPPVTGSTW